MLRQLEPAHTAGVSSLSVFGDTTLCSTSLDKTAALWDIRTGNRIQQLVAHRDAVNTSLFLADGLRLLTASEDRTVIVWDQRNLSQPAFVCSGFGDGINKMCVSGDGTLLYTAVDSGMVFVHDLVPQLPLKYRYMASSAPINDIMCVQLASGKDVIVTGCDDKAIRTWLTGSIDDKPEGTEGEDRLIASLEAFETPVNHIIFHQGWVFAASAENIVAVDFDPSTGEFGGGGKAYIGHQDYVRGMGFIGSQGEKMLSVSDDKTAIEWDVATTQPEAGAQLHNDLIMAMALTDDRSALFTGCEDGSIRHWPLPLPRAAPSEN